MSPGVLRQRNFWPYFAGNLISNCGTWFQNLAQSILIYRATGSTFLVGAVNFAQFIGVFVLAPWAGPAADRYDRRRLILTTQGIAAIGAVALALAQVAGVATTPVVMGLALVTGAAFAFALPAIQAMVPDLVPAENLPSAMAMSSVTFNLGRAIGPPLGALVVAHWGFGAAFGINALSYLAFMAGLLAVRPVQAERPADGPAPRWRESLAMVRRDHALLALLLVVVAISVTQDPVSTLTPGFSEEIFGRSDTVTGLLVGAFGVGSALAAATAAGRWHPVRRLGPGCIVMGVAMLAFGLAPSLPFAAAALFVGGFCFMVVNTGATTSLALEAAPGQRGRVMALWSLCFLGTRPLASLLDGALASAAGLRPAAVVLTLPVLIAGPAMLILRRRNPRLRAFGGGPIVAPDPTP
jgi:MFS family permease